MADAPVATDPAPILTNGTLRLRRCRHGVMLYDLASAPQGALLDRYGEYSEGQTDIFRQQLRPGMTVVEVGANIGAHTISLAHAVGPQGRVVAFEPRRSMFQILCANLALNAVEHVEARWAAVGAAARYVGVRRPTAAGQVDKVQLVTLDGLELPACHLIKIDEKGLEADVIQGARQTILRHKPVIYVGNEVGEKSAALIQLLWDLEYDCYWHEAARVRVPNFRGDAENGFPDLVSVSLLCVPRSRQVNVTGFRKVESVQDGPQWKGVLPLSSTNIVALNDRGLTLHAQKRFEEALACYDRAIALKSDIAEILYNRGNALAALRRFEEGLASYDQALTVNPGYVSALNNRGWLLEQMQRFDDALASYDKALALKPDDAKALENHAALTRRHKAAPATPPSPAPAEKKKLSKPAAAAVPAKTPAVMSDDAKALEALALSLQKRKAPSAPPAPAEKKKAPKQAAVSVKAAPAKKKPPKARGR